jgi:fibronectin type 3 domain-containing protein
MTWGAASPLLLTAIGAVAAMGVSMEAAALSQELTDQRGMGITTREAAGLRRVVYGPQRIGGVNVYESTTGVNGASGTYCYNYVIALASHVLDGIVNIYLDGRQVCWSQAKNTQGFHANIGCGTVSEPPVTQVAISDGVIAGITASTLGSGFAEVAPQDGYRVRIYDPAGTGSGAEAWAYLSNGAWIVDVASGGSNYSSQTIADIQGAFTWGGGGANTQQAPHTTATATVAGGAVTSIGSIHTSWLDNFRYPVNCVPPVSISGGGGFGAAAHCVMVNGQVSEIVVDDGGQNYTSAPTVTIGTGNSGVTIGDCIGPGGQSYGFQGKVFAEARFGDQPLGDYMQSLTVNDSTWAPTAAGTPSLQGCAYIYLNVGYDTSLFPNAPEVRITVNGKPVFDPRTGLTQFSSNWALQVADVITDPIFGLGDNTVNQAQLIAAANVCDEQIQTSQGLESNFAQGIHYDTSTAPGAALDLMMPSAQGRLSRIGGEWYIWPAYWQGPSFTCDESWLIATPEWNSTRSLRDLCNVINGTYVAPNSPYNVEGNLYDSNGWYYGTTANLWPLAWQPTNYPSYAADTLHGYAGDVFLQDDGGIVLPAELTLRGVNSIVQAQRLAKIKLMRNRFQGTGTTKMNLAAWQMIPTSVMQFNWSAMGWTNKYLEIDKLQLAVEPMKDENGEDGAPALYIAASVNETDPSCYEWSLSEELTPYDVTACPGATPYTVPPPTNLTLENDAATALPGPNGTSISRMLVQWTPPTDPYVTISGSIQVQYALTATSGTTQTSNWIDAGSVSGSATCMYIPNIPSTQNISVQLRSVRASGTASAWVGVSYSTIAAGIPEAVTLTEITGAPVNLTGQVQELVSITFAPQANDPNFDHVLVYFSNYQGNPNPVLMYVSSTGQEVITLLAAITGETVTITLVSASATGVQSSFAAAPTGTLTFNGVTGAPPAPSIAVAQTGLASGRGWQFSFNILGGLDYDLVSGYRVYHSESNATPVPPADQYQFIAQPASNVGTITVQEDTGDILYYWVSAINSSGLESALTSVPFVYIDPGAAPPASVTPVTTTTTSLPVVALNGWATGTHVNYQPDNPVNGASFGPAEQTVSPFTNPANACNGGSTAAATFSQTHNAEYAGCVWAFSNFAGIPAGTTVTAATLSVSSQVLATSGCAGQGSIWYSLDGGNSWIQMYATENSARSKRTDNVTIPVTQTFTNIQVMACAHSHDDLAMSVFSISLAVTQSAPSGPGAVTGVAATLDSTTNNVKIGWNGLLPLTRTDILSYEVYRATHGAGFTMSHLQDTVTPNGSATYSWEDPETHGSGWDYWVIANNAAGWSPASDVVTITSSASAVYSTGATLESLKPAQAGADITAQNASAGVTNGSATRAAVDLINSINSGGGVNFNNGTHTGCLPYANTATVIQGAIASNGNVQNLGGTAASSITPIATLMPAQAGADQTGLNTALNTQNVGARVAGDVVATVQSGGGIDFSSALHAHKTLDNVANGTANFSVKAIDGNGKALVDFTQSGHVGKTVDNIGDGSTYARPLASRLTSGVPNTYRGAWVASASYLVGDEVAYPSTAAGNYYVCTVANSAATWTAADWQLVGPATVDVVADGTTYARTKAAGLTNGGVNYAASAHTGILPRANHCSDVTTAIAVGGNVQNVNGMAASRVQTLALSSGTTSASLLTNGNFENGLTGWTNNGSCVIDTSTTWLGTQSCKIPSGTFGYVYQQSITLQAGYTYVLQGWVKTDGALTQNPALYFYDAASKVSVLSVSGGMVASQPTYPGVQISVTAALPWTLLQAVVTVSATDTVVLYAINNYGTGAGMPANVWFDGLSLVDITASSAQLGGVAATNIIDSNGHALNSNYLGGVVASSITPIAGLMPSQAGADVSTNMVPCEIINPGFEAGNTGWGLGSGWTIASGTAFSGTRSGVFTGAGTAAITSNAMVACAPGQSIAAQCMANAASAVGGSGGCIRVTFYNAAGTYLTYTAPPTYITPGTAGWNQSRYVTQAPANAYFYQVNYAVYGQTSGTHYVDAFATSILPNSVDEVLDGTTYQRMPAANMDSNRRALVDFSQSAHINKTMDYVPDGVTRFGAAQANADKTASHVLTVGVSLSSGATTSGTTPVSAPGLGWSLSASGVGDVYNIWAQLLFQNSSTTLGQAVEILLVLDGNTSSPVASSTYYVAPGSGSVCQPSFFTSVSGLSSGTHTLQFYICLPSSSGVAISLVMALTVGYPNATKAICQRIY